MPSANFSDDVKLSWSVLYQSATPPTVILPGGLVADGVVSGNEVEVRRPTVREAAEEIVAYARLYAETRGYLRA